MHVDDRGFVKPLPERKRQEPHRRKNRQRDDEMRPEPVVLLALIEHDLQGSDAQRQQRDAHVVKL